MLNIKNCQLKHLIHCYNNPNFTFLSEDNFLKIFFSSLCEACLPLTGVKLNVRPEVSTEPTHFLTLINNGKAFSSLDGMACSYQCSDQFQFLPGH